MELHEKLTEWAVSRGTKLNGITAHRFPGKGMGIIAQRNIQAGEVLMTSPMSTIRTELTIPEAVSKPISLPCSVNGLLAAELALDKSSSHELWRSGLPKMQDFKESMPVMWPMELQHLLPPSAQSILAKQHTKISLDYEAVGVAFADLPYDVYCHNWLLVSTRTFYYTAPEVTSPPANSDECLAIIPYADYFNHGDTGCKVQYSPSEYEMTADRPYKKGEEVHISYGNHSNDFLLVEYGFILEENQWDQIDLDELMTPLFSPTQAATLREERYWGNFVLDRATVCYRTQVALRLLCMPLKRWRRSLANGFDEDDKYQAPMNALLFGVLNSYMNLVDEIIHQVNALECGRSPQGDTIRRRWEQVRSLVSTAIGRTKD